LEDLKGAFPAGRTRFYKVDPGDEIICDQHGSELRRSANRFVSSTRSEEELVAFCPVDPFESLLKDNSVLNAVEAGISRIIDDLDYFVQHEIESPPLNSYKKWKVLYQLVVCSEGGNVFVNWDFGGDARRVDGRSTRATATSIISRRVLSAMANGACSWEEAYNSGEWRFFQTVAAVSADSYLHPRGGEIVDILQLRYPYAQALEGLIAEDLKRWIIV
jgi:hypothetical protein